MGKDLFMVFFSTFVFPVFIIFSLFYMMFHPSHTNYTHACEKTPKTMKMLYVDCPSVGGKIIVFEDLVTGNLLYQSNHGISIVQASTIGKKELAILKSKGYMPVLP